MTESEVGMSGLSLILLSFLGFLITWALVPAIQHYLHSAGRRQLHHTHTAPIPRFGGLALAMSYLAVTALGLMMYPAGSLARVELSFSARSPCSSLVL